MNVSSGIGQRISRRNAGEPITLGKGNKEKKERRVRKKKTSLILKN